VGGRFTEVAWMFITIAVVAAVVVIAVIINDRRFK
jgi:hypothetical protein